MWHDSVAKRRARYMYLLKGSVLYHETAKSCLEDTENEDTAKREKVIRDVSICVLAPAMNAFAVWVLKAALKNKPSLFSCQRRIFYVYHG